MPPEKYASPGVAVGQRQAEEMDRGRLWLRW